MRGYIKDYRKELNSDIWMMPPMYHRVWQYLKYKANHEQKKIPLSGGSFIEIQAGQHLTSLRTIAQGVAYYQGMQYREPNPKTVSTILDWLEENDMITVERGKGNRQYTLITLLNWEIYQAKDNGGNSNDFQKIHGGVLGGNSKETAQTSTNQGFQEQSSNRGNSKETAKKQQLDINKNDKNDKNNINNIQQQQARNENPFVMYQTCFGKFPSPLIIEDINHYLNNGMEEKLVAFAIYKASRNGEKFNYARGILTNWETKGITTYEQALNEEEVFKQARNKNIRVIEGGKENEVDQRDYRKDRKNTKYDFSKRRNL